MISLATFSVFISILLLRFKSSKLRIFSTTIGSERSIFPGQRLIFTAITSALLEIYTSESATDIPSDVIPCQHLLLVTAYSYWTRKNVLNELVANALVEGGSLYSCREIEAVLKQVLNELPDNYNTFTEKDSPFCVKLSW